MDVNAFASYDHKVIPVTFAIGTATTAEVDLGKRFTYIGIEYDANWATWPTLTFLVATQSGGTFKNLLDESGTEVQVYATASKSISVDLSVLKLEPWRYIELRAGNSGAGFGTNSSAATVQIIVK